MRLLSALLFGALLGLIVLHAGRTQPADPVSERNALLEELRRDGITSEEVLGALGRIPRHRFVPDAYQSRAYENRPLPIGNEQTISQPYIVAFMTETLQLAPTDRVLEVGTGSGYQAAVLAELAREVYSIEIIAELGERARTLLQELGYSNVQVRIGDGYRGWPEAAPFDAVILTAAPERIPQPLLDQLAVGGRLIAPVGGRSQHLILVVRTETGFERTQHLPVRFVPMTGEAQESNE